jgi:hypothetical protein
VNYATGNGTAIAGSDYTAKSGTLNWSDGDAANKTFTVAILDDGTYEGNETFAVNLSGASGASLGSPASATTTIEDDEWPPEQVISLAPTQLTPSCPEGQNASNQTFTVWNSGGGNLEYTIADNASWLSITPTNGSGGTNTHTVNYSTAGLPVGTTNTLITITGNATNSPQTILVSLTVIGGPSTRYVNVSNATPQAPYTSWAIAATNIQDAVDAAWAGDTVLVTNGIYATGGKPVHGSMTNRVAVDKAITLLSVNGPSVTTILGQGPVGNAAVRCVYAGSNAFISGFTLSAGATRATGDWFLEQSGGGMLAESDATISNCVLAFNAAAIVGGGAYGGRLVQCVLSINSAVMEGGGAWESGLERCVITVNTAGYYGGGVRGGTARSCVITGNSAAHGGGACDGVLQNCLLSRNTASARGGGANGSVLESCTLSGNSAAAEGGGQWMGSLYNCIVYYNDAPTGPNWVGGSFDYCCTTPTPTNGMGHITAEPRFLDTNDWTDLRLAFDSPCINAGTNEDWMVGAVDLAGHPRIMDGTVDMGAYEFFPFDYVLIEAEDGILTAPIIASSDPAASRGQFIATTNSNNGVAEYAFDAAGGRYVVWARCAAGFPNAAARNSFIVTMDGATNEVWDLFYEMGDAPLTNWTWDLVSTRGASVSPYVNELDPRTFDLAPGTHTLRFQGREYGTKLDALLITSDPGYQPAGLAGDAPVVGVPSLDGVPTLSIRGMRGRTIEIWGSTNLTDGWELLGTFMNHDGVVTFTDPVTNAPQRFYRAIQRP